MQTAPIDFNDNYKLAKQIWLSACCLCVVLMIIIGGYTRLSGSGLSMTGWQPLYGTLPPLTDSAWQAEFDNYKNSPEYQQINNFFELEEFKEIYLVEYFHRLAARVTGLVYLLPLIILWRCRAFLPHEKKLYLLTGTLLASQAIMGWLMVKSGLVDAPRVSHFRLAAHLSLAVIVYSILFWQLICSVEDMILMIPTDILLWLQRLLYACLGLSYLQIILGAFVAGLHAGLIYNSFPLMGDGLVPEEVQGLPMNFASLSDPIFIQLCHRLNAYLLAVVTFITCLLGFSVENNKIRKVFGFILIALGVQFISGVLTLIYVVPINLALIHQLGAIFLISTLLWGLKRLGDV